MKEELENELENEKELSPATEEDLEKEEIENEGNILNPEQEEIDEAAKYKDLLMRTKAEFENYKKRSHNEISNYIKYASESVLKELLPVYDDLCRSVDSIEKGETKDFETLKTGVEMIKEKFKKVLAEEGVTEINSLGKPYDVETSTALMQVENEEVDPNTVVDVVEKGYRLKDKIIRHEKVVVSK